MTPRLTLPLDNAEAIEAHRVTYEERGRPEETWAEVTAAGKALRFTATLGRAEQIRDALRALLTAGLNVTITNPDGSAVELQQRGA